MRPAKKLTGSSAKALLQQNVSTAFIAWALPISKFATDQSIRGHDPLASVRVPIAGVETPFINGRRAPADLAGGCPLIR